MAKDLTLNRNSQQDNNQVYSLLGVQGTAGTADTGGTSPVMPVSLDPATGAIYVNDLSGAVGTTTIAGTVVVSSGTVVGNVASGTTDSGNPIKIGGIYNATPPTLTDGQRGDSQLDVNANTQINVNTLLAGENLTTNRLNNEPVYSFSYIATATTTTAKTGAGTLHSITIEGGTTGTIIIYDNTAASGTIIASYDSTNYPYNHIFDVSFGTGLTIITSAATKITITYR